MLKRTKKYISQLDSMLKADILWENLKNKTVLVTGASGMVGTVILDVILKLNNEKGYNIRIIAISRNESEFYERFLNSNDEITYISHDINSPLPEIGDIDYIIHAASNTHPVAYSTQPISTITTNIIGTYNLLNYGVLHKLESFVLLSTVEIYGEGIKKNDVFTEEYCGYINCNTLRAGYPESKRVSEALCQGFIKEYGIKAYIPRLSRLYGPTMLSSDTKAISQFIKNAAENKDIVLKSKGEQRFSYCYVVDAVLAIFTILFNGASGDAYNVCDDSFNMQLKDIAKAIANTQNKQVIFQIPPDAEKQGYSVVNDAVMQNDKLKKLGWIPAVSFNDGLLTTIDTITASR